MPRNPLIVRLFSYSFVECLPLLYNALFVTRSTVLKTNGPRICDTNTCVCAVRHDVNSMMLNIHLYLSLGAHVLLSSRTQCERSNRYGWISILRQSAFIDKRTDTTERQHDIPTKIADQWLSHCPLAYSGGGAIGQLPSVWKFIAQWFFEMIQMAQCWEICLTSTDRNLVARSSRKLSYLFFFSSNFPIKK